jgi:hypothetical protein
MQSLEAYWTPTALMGQCEPIPVTDIAAVISESMGSPSTSRPTIYAHTSPFQKNSYTIWIRTRIENVQSMIHKFMLRLPPASLTYLPHLSLQWSLRWDHRTFNAIPYAGQALYGGDISVLALSKLDIMSVRETIWWRRLGIPKERHTVHISNYSGAITYSMGDSITINYYK